MAPSAASIRTTDRVARRWILPAPDDAALPGFARQLQLSLPAARVVWQRGYRHPDAARAFLHPTLDALHDPALLSGMDRAVARLHTAIEQKQPILLYGDYDVDGTTSIVILKKAIDLAGGAADFHVPHRLRDGYGMRPEVIAEAAARGVRLIISVDTGIRSVEVVREAERLGVDMIITDHHLPDAEIPPALAVLNPNQPGCAYPEKNLCGAGVTFKLIQALLPRLGWSPTKSRALLESFLKMVAIATVADVVPLTGENRVIVKTGLAGLENVRNLGLRALIEAAGFPPGERPTATQVAFRIAPRINAAGRMANATDVIELFLTDSAERARELAAQLNDLNAERQQTEAAMVDAILKECEQTPVGPDDFALVFSREGWHRGVVGIVASRIVERFGRPVFVLGEEKGRAQGSGRSIRPFHLLDALESMPGLFDKFGGHRQAAGLTLAAERVGEFRERLNAHARALLTAEDLQPTLELDAIVRVDELGNQPVQQVLELGPFGFGNPAPVFAMLDVELVAPPQIIKDKHVRLRFSQGGRRTQSAIAWNLASAYGTLPPGARLDVAVRLEEDAYSASRGYDPWQAVVQDVRVR